MSTRNILAISSSRAGNSGYLEKAAPMIMEFLGTKPLRIAFIGFAAADSDYESYAGKVREALKDTLSEIIPVLPENPEEVIQNCEAVMVGGGNTFKLLHDIYKLNLFSLIREKINAGTPYIGWSAGSNITGLSIGTTNDMPIIGPPSFKSFGFFPFQINPHYLNLTTESFHGETRDQRLEEFLIVNPSLSVICLPEGTALLSRRGQTFYRGHCPGYILSMSGNREIQKKEILNGEQIEMKQLNETGI